MKAATRIPSDGGSVSERTAEIVVDTFSMPVFDAINHMAAQICGVAMAGISLSDGARSTVYANVELPRVTRLSLETAFCFQSTPGQPFVEVTDASNDAQLALNPFVAGNPNIRFYAAVPVTIQGGHQVGVLCVADRAPSHLTQLQRSLLERLAKIVGALLIDGLHWVALAGRTGNTQANIRTGVESEAELISLLQPDGHIIYAGEAHAQCLGLKQHEVVGSNFLDFVNETDRRAVAESLRRVCEGKASIGVESRMLNPDGKTRWVKWTSRALADSSGTSVVVHSVGRDITQLKRVEHALADSERRYRQIYDDAPAMLHSIDSRGCLISVSKVWLKTLGYDRAEVLGRPSADFITAASREYAQRVVLPAFFEKGYCDDVEYQMVRKDGEVIDVLLSAILERDDEGKPLRSFAVIKDITERKRIESSLADREQRYRALFEHMQVGCALLEMETGEHQERVDFRFLAVNPALAKMTKRTSAWLVGRTLSEAYPDVVSQDWNWRETLASVTLTGEPASLQNLPGVGGGWFDLVAYRPGPCQCAILVQETTRQKRMQAILAEQHEQLRVTLHSIGDAVITTDRQGRVTYLNPVAERLTGRQLDETRGRALEEVFHTVHEITREPASNPVTHCLATNSVVALAENTVLVSRDGREYAIEDSAAPITGSNGDVLGVVLVFHDVSEQRRLAKEMTYRATHDALTGLTNRAEFEIRLVATLADARDGNNQHTLLYIDLDQFKIVNDTCGHTAGDQLLRQVSELLQRCIRAGDTLARLGGDEFGVILNQCNAEQGLAVASELRSRIDEYRFIYDQRRFHIGASIGLVPIDGSWTSVAAVLQAADSACYVAKEGGRNRVHSWFDADQTAIARHGEMQWVARLEQALEEGQFELHAQRIESVGGPDKRLRCELLLRLRESDGTLVLPGVFLAAAERFQMASRIDRWVVHHVFAWMARHSDQLEHVESIAINLSGQSIGDQAFHRYVGELIRDFNIDTHKLCFEITETAAITNLRTATEFIESLQRHGVHFALDDFGSGASSFGYLKVLPVDYLKIDGQFVRNLLDDPIDQAMVRCICDVAHAVGKETIAEFVETADAAVLLEKMGVNYVQGYGIHFPAPFEEVIGPKIITRRMWQDEAVGVRPRRSGQPPESGP